MKGNRATSAGSFLRKQGLRILAAAAIGFAMTLVFSQLAAGTGVLSRISTSSSGGEGNGNSNDASMSEYGRYVAFESASTNLVSGDTDNCFYFNSPTDFGYENCVDVFLKDTEDGTATRISTDSSGTEANGHSGNPSISDSGRYIAFDSFASNLVLNDGNVQDVFLKDSQMGTTSRLSNSIAGEEGNGDSLEPSISGDGSRTAFKSDASNLVMGDNNGVSDVFVRDTQTNQTTRVSTASAGGGEGNSWSMDASISSDGRYVAFASFSSNLDPNDWNGRQDVFVKDTQTNNTTRISVCKACAEGWSENGDSYRPSISSDGRYVAFVSDASNMVGGDNNDVPDIFVADTWNNTITLESTSSAAVLSNNWNDGPSISANGRYVAFFSLGSNLVPGDNNGKWDVFVKDTNTGATRRISTDLGGVQGDDESARPSISDDASYAAFTSAATNLVSSDENGKWDIFKSSTQACPESMPSLTPASLKVYWQNYAAYTLGSLSVDHSVGNSGSGMAYSLKVTGMTATNGVSCTTDMPVDIGDLSGYSGSLPFTLTYNIPSGVGSFNATLFARARDACGRLYFYPYNPNPELPPPTPGP